MRRSVRAETGPPTPRVATAGDVAWLAAAPALLVVVLAVIALGPWLGRVLFPAQSPTLFREALLDFRPEPTEHARYLIVLVGPLLVSGAVALCTRQRIRLRSRTLRVSVLLSQVLVVALLAGSLAAQDVSLSSLAAHANLVHLPFFSSPTLVIAGVTAVLLAVTLRLPGLAARAQALVRETPHRRTAAVALAVLFAVVWELSAFNTDGSLPAANPAGTVNYSYWLDETFAVLNGQPPLVALQPQYAQLWPYLTAGVMSLTAASIAVFSTVMVTGTIAALLAVFATLRRAAGSSIGALALYLPFVATGFFIEIGPLENRYGPANLFSLFPMRYGGPYVLAWLVARHLDGCRPRRPAMLCFCAGLVAINNVEFGAPALVATFAALLWTSARMSWSSLARLARDGAVGLLGAVAAVSVLTLVVAGSLPRFSTAFTFARLCSVDGLSMIPMDPFGLHLVLYGTFAAAIVLATVRAVGREEPLLTGLLVWSGIFGLGAGSYFVGRSHPDVLIDVFSTWAFALALLIIAAIRSVRRRRSHLVSPIELALFFAGGLALCSIAQTPTPWSQIDRLATTAPARPDAEAHSVRLEQELRRATRPGEHVSIITAAGHRAAYDVGIVDVMPYTFPELVDAVQVDEIVALLRAAHGHKVFADAAQFQDVIAAFERAGFRPSGPRHGTDLLELDDRRRVPPG